ELVPKMRDLSKVLRDPRIGIDRLQIALTAVGEDQNAIGIVGNLVLDSLKGHENSAGGAACEDPLLPYQDAASHHALEVRAVDTPIDDLRWKERRYDRRSVPRNQPARLLVAEDGAADRVDGENLSLEVIGPSVFRAAPNRSAGARSAKQEVDFAVQ